MRQPRTIPVLTPDDFIIGPLEDHEGRYCLIGWKEKVFDEEMGGDLYAGIHTETLTQCCINAGYPHIMDIDTYNTPENRRAAAAIWADFTEKIGYVEDGPETTID